MPAFGDCAQIERHLPSKEERAVMQFLARLGCLLQSAAIVILSAGAVFGQSTARPQPGPQLKPPVTVAIPSPVPVAAIPAPAPSPAAVPQSDATADKRAENAELLKLAQQKLEAGDPSDADAAQAVAMYTSVEAVLAQQEAVDGQIKDLAARKAELEKQLQFSRAGSSSDAKPCSFIELDQLKDSLRAEQARINLVADRLTAAKSALERASIAGGAGHKSRQFESGGPDGRFGAGEARGETGGRDDDAPPETTGPPAARSTSSNT
jgi:hypothetical protein